MAVCSKCGSVVSDGASFCSVCGSPVAVVTAPATPPPPQPQGYAASAGTAAAGMTSNIAAALACLPYIGLITGIIFLVLEPYKRDRFIRFYAFQSIFLAIAAFLLRIVWGFLMTVSALSSGFLWALFGGIATLIWIAFFVAWVFLMYKAYNNEKFKLPLIGDMADKQA